MSMGPAEIKLFASAFKLDEYKNAIKWISQDSTQDDSVYLTMDIKNDPLKVQLRSIEDPSGIKKNGPAGQYTFVIYNSFSTTKNVYVNLNLLDKNAYAEISNVDFTNFTSSLLSNISNSITKTYEMQPNTAIIIVSGIYTKPVNTGKFAELIIHTSGSHMKLIITLIIILIAACLGMFLYKKK